MSTWGQGGFRKSVKAAVLARDPICALGYPGCTHYSTECDHVVSIALLGIARRDANEQDCQGVCHSCHQKKTRAETNAAIKVSAARRDQRLHPTRYQKHPGDL